MLKAIPDFIDSFRKNSIAKIYGELEQFSENSADLAFCRWHDALEPMRKYFCNLIYKHNPAWGHFYNCDDHLIDHHIHGFIAPIHNYRIGFSGAMLEPEQQLEHLARQFQERGCRFIYLALPCKKALYPEIILPRYLYNHVPSIIPQWRRMLLKLMKRGIEVIDAFPCLKEIKKMYEDNGKQHFPPRGHASPAHDKNMAYSIFSWTHDISALGADKIAKTLADYIRDSTADIPTAPFFQKEEIVFEENERVWPTSRIFFHHPRKGIAPYKGDEIKSEIGIFGNCNLQKYRGTGIDITSKLSWLLQSPVNYCGRILPFDFQWNAELDKLPDGVFTGKKIVIYLGFPSASYVRSPVFPGKWAINDLPTRFFAKSTN